METVENKKWRKVFKQDGKVTLRFAKDSKEQIMGWLNGIDYDYAVKFAREVDCPVFGKALDFPCVVTDAAMAEMEVDYKIIADMILKDCPRNYVEVGHLNTESVIFLDDAVEAIIKYFKN